MNNPNYFQRLYAYIRALAGNPAYQYKVAQMISQSPFPDAKENALRWYDLASKNSHDLSTFELAVYTINHEKNNDKAIEILKRAKEGTNPKIESLLGQMLLSKYTDVIDHRRFEKENKIRSAKGQDELDRYIQSLMPIQAKPKRELDLNITDDQLNAYLEAALQRLGHAQKLGHPLGYHAHAIYLIQYAEDTKENKQNGLNQLKHAVKMNFAPSCQVMAGIYENGLFGIKPDIRRGLELRVIAAEQGSKDSQFTLGYLVYNGQGFEENQELGLKLIRTAADNGHIEAKDFLKQLKRVSHA